MGKVFISYSRRDTETVDRIANAIENAGMGVWLDRHNIRAGNEWRVQIVRAIDTCDAFVLMLSPNSAVSENVRKEIDLAQDSGRKLFVLMLEPVRLPAEIRYQLAGLQFVDVQLMGLDEAVKMLIDTLKEHIAPLQSVEEPGDQQAELVIRGIDLLAFGADKQEQLLKFIAQLTNASQNQLSIAGMAAGSVHVFIEMPAGSAYQLKTLALNRDRRFKQLQIVSMRLVGDKKYINIALGVLTTAATIGFLQSLWLGMPALLPSVVGIAVGKGLTISLATLVTIGVIVSAPQAIAPLFIPPSTRTSTPTETPAATYMTTSLSPQEVASTMEEITSTPLQTVPASKIATVTVTASPSASPTPQNPLVLRDTVCFKEPRVNDRVVSRLDMNTRVELRGRADTGGWWLVVNPIYESLCWVLEGDLELDPAMDVSTVPIFYIFSNPSNACSAASYYEDPVCYCNNNPGDSYCL